MKALFLLLIPAMSFGQWYKIDLNDVAVIATQSIAGGFDGWNQNIIHHRYGVGKPFWDNHTSWKRKYKDYDNGDLRAKFFLSKSVLVGATDGFHMTRSVSRMATLATIGIVAGDWKDYPKGQRWLIVAKKIVLSIIANRVTFQIVYK